MFNAFLLVVAVAFVFLVSRTYYRRWRNDRGQLDPRAGERSRLQRAKNDSQSNIGPNHGGQTNLGSGSGFGP